MIVLEKFKPFDKVIGRFGEFDKWSCALFSHLETRTNGTVVFVCCGDVIYHECHPYNETTAKYVGTAIDILPSKHNRFKPFDKVIVRYNTGCKWRCDFFSNYVEDPQFNKVPYRCVSGTYAHCIPFNEKTEKYLNTYDNPKQEDLL